MKILIFLLLAVNVFSQSNCYLTNSKENGELTADKNDILCLAKDSEKRHTLFFTFASWCKPCRLHLPDAVDLQKNHNVDLYIVLPDSEGGDRLTNTIQYLKENYPNVKMLVLKSSVYGTSLKSRNRKFIEDITPRSFEVIDDFSKFIIIDKNGEVLFVSNWKDYDKDWKDGKAMVQKKIISLLK